MECLSEARRLEIKRICECISSKYDSKVHLGVLLCEGEENSIDVKLYSKVYPYLLVIPSGGCSDIIKMIHSVRKKNEEISILGLIDRDANSKKEIRKLEEESIYCTKLPFIENIICTPEVIKIFSRRLNIDYDQTIKKINEEVLKLFAQKLKDVFPVNVSISYDDLIDNVFFSIKKKNGITLEKTVSESNILYRYRDKMIANVVAYALGLNGRQSYYEFVKDMLEDIEVSHKLIKVTRAYLPMIKV